MATSRGDAAAATWTFRGDESRRRRGRDVDIPRSRASRRGYFGETSTRRRFFVFRAASHGRVDGRVGPEHAPLGLNVRAQQLAHRARAVGVAVQERPLCGVIRSRPRASSRVGELRAFYDRRAAALAYFLIRSPSARSDPRETAAIRRDCGPRRRRALAETACRDANARAARAAALAKIARRSRRGRGACFAGRSLGGSGGAPGLRPPLSGERYARSGVGGGGPRVLPPPPAHPAQFWPKTWPICNRSEPSCGRGVRGRLWFEAV